MLLAQLVLNGLIAGCAYALVALGFALIYNTSRIFHFAHGAVYVLAAYAFYTFHTKLDTTLLVSIPVTLIAASLLGLAIDYFVYRPLDKKQASLLLHLLSSLGVYIIVVNTLAMFYGNDTKVLSAEVQSTYRVFGLVANQIQLITVVCFLIVTGLMVACLRRTTIGLLIRAMRDEPVALSLLGTNPQRIRHWAFVLGSALAAIAAILLGLDVGIDPHIGMNAILTAAVAMIIGGIGVFEGAALGGLLLGASQSLAVWQLSARWQELVTFVLLIAFLLFRPQGLFGDKRRLEEAP